jgi:hypothetical protein
MVGAIVDMFAILMVVKVTDERWSNRLLKEECNERIRKFCDNQED